jgi:hypothetical protein
MRDRDMERYRQALDNFLVATKNNVMTFSDAPSYVRLDLEGTWEVTDVPTCNLRAAFYDEGRLVPHGICLPLVQPLSEEALVTCLDAKRHLVEAKEEEEAFYRELYDD